MLDNIIKLKDEILSYRNLIYKFEKNIAELEYIKTTKYTSAENNKSIDKEIYDYNQTIKKYERFIKKLEKRLKNEYTEYLV